MYIVFDIGGTKMRVASSPDGKAIGRVLKEKTPVEDFDEGINFFGRMVRDLVGTEPIEGVSGGIAGPLTREKDRLANAPNIPGWVGQPLKKKLAEACDAPVFVENDSAIVGLGEATAGAGRGYSVVAYITVSTGVGGTRVVDGRIDKSAFGFEPGHQVVDASGDLCPSCGASGDLEALVSGTGVSRQYGKDPREIIDPEIWKTVAQNLSYGLNNVAVLWSPEVIVLGGAMITGDPEIPLDAIERSFNATLKIFPEKPAIKKAELADEGGLYGALAFLRENLKI